MKKQLLLMIVGVLLVVVGTTHAVWAAVTGVSVSPTSSILALGRSGSVKLGWLVTSNAAGKLTITSTQGVFLAPNGAALGSVDSVLTLSAEGPGVANASETVLVPASVIHLAHKQGLDRLIYRRSFDDSSGASTGTLTLFISTPQAAGFAVSRLALFFDDGKTLRVVGRGQSLVASAEARLVGAGLLNANWEVAGPHADARHPDFRTLTTVNRQVTGDPVILESPDLPTHATGVYLVRLRVSRPAPAFDAPVIRYYVGGGIQ